MSYIIAFATFSTTEQVVGKWVDGKTIYRRTYSFGALTSGGTKRIDHNITNLDLIVNFFGNSRLSNNNQRPIPFPGNTSAYDFFRVTVNATEILIESGTNTPGTADAYMTLYYTKTS